MSKNFRKILSVLLAAAMLFSHVHVTHAANNDKAADAPAVQQTETETDGSKELELEDLDPASLNVKKVGEIEEDDVDPGELTPDLSLDQTVRVTIFLKAPSALQAGYTTEKLATNSGAAAYRDALEGQQNDLAARIATALGHSFTVKWHLTLLANAISANVKVKEIPIIEKLDGVAGVVQSEYYEAPVVEESDDPQTAMTSSGMTGAVQVWSDGYTGAGMKIAIIDTGLDTSHQSFDSDAFDYAIAEVNALREQQDLEPVSLMTEADLAAVVDQLHVSGVYLNSKIPFAYNYIDGNTDVTHLNDIEENHGSHVTGIAAANRYLNTADGFVDAAPTVYAVGQAPDAQVLVMKVFGQGGGAYQDDYFTAIEDALTLGCNSVNLSLGGGDPGFTYNTSGSTNFPYGFQELLNVLADPEVNPYTVVSISAGNSGSFADNLGDWIYAEDVWMHTGGSPGTFLNSFCVASADNIGSVGLKMTFNGSQYVLYTEAEAKNADVLSSIVGDYEFVYINSNGYADDYAAVNAEISLKGKVVIVNRGDITFVEKGNNLIEYEPAALIIANNQAGRIGLRLDDYTGTFPMASITLADANGIKANSDSTTVGSLTVYTGSVNIDDVLTLVQTTTRDEATVSSFSSWGVPGSLVMKPEITAPGGNIYSLNGTYNTSSGLQGGTDQYVSFSGTSMAAPHIAGLSALVAQYIEENDGFANEEAALYNKSLTEKYSERAIIQSLLMSTATPMVGDNSYFSYYYPVLQQGAGLVDASLATSAASVLMVGQDDDTLTALTGMAADGKVKVEFGDDPDRTGIYKYSFTLYNITDEPLIFEVGTDLFIQYPDGDQMSPYTYRLAEDKDFTATYNWADLVSMHDVDKDSDTDEDDAQAILDYVAGALDGSTLDLEAGEMDGEEGLTSYDAYLLLKNLESGKVVVPAHGERTCTVTLTLNDSTKELIEYCYENGTYIQGFTYADCVQVTDEGLILDHEHSIPLLGFYGSWTDPSMFDCVTVLDQFYSDEEKIPYGDTYTTNYMTVNYGGKQYIYTGNPYTFEDTFPYDRLALNSSTVIPTFVYTLLRSAGTVDLGVSLVDELGGDVTEMIGGGILAYGVDGMYYYVNGETWYNTVPTRAGFGVSAGVFGLEEGDLFRVGLYAIPEYYGILAAEDPTVNYAGYIAYTSDLVDLIESNTLGDGAYIGYDLKIDDTYPTITKAILDGTKLTVTVEDNEALAYVAVMTTDGEVYYAEDVPGESTYIFEDLDIADAIEEVNGYLAIFAADYAANETAKAIKVNDKGVDEKVVYVLTDKLTTGNEYLIVNTDTEGEGFALAHTGKTVFATDVTVKPADDTVQDPYIVSVPASAVWKAANGFTLANDDAYLAAVESGETMALTAAEEAANWSWNESKNRLIAVNGDDKFYVTFDDGFALTEEAASVYLYKKTVIRTASDPTEPAYLTISPESMLLYINEEADIAFDIGPLTADCSLTWLSEDTGVAWVDDYGHVVATGEGTTRIKVTANGNPDLVAVCEVTVFSIDKEFQGIVWDEDGQVFFSSFNTKSLPRYNKLHSEPVGIYLHSGTPAYSGYNLYASLDTQTGATDLYLLKEGVYAVTDEDKLGPNYLWANDVAPVYSYNEEYYFAYSYGSNFLLGLIDPYNEVCGMVVDGVGLKNVLGTTASGQQAYIASIALKSRDMFTAEYFILDENGVIWELDYDYLEFYYSYMNAETEEEAAQATGFVDLKKIAETGISCSFLYQNMYYDGEYIYWSSQNSNTNVSTLYVIDLENGTINSAGDFGDGVWPMTAIYEAGVIAPGEASEASPEIARPENFTPKALITAEEEAAVNARLLEEAAKFGKQPVTAPDTVEEPMSEAAEPVEEVTEAPAEVPAEVTEEPAEEPAPEVTEEVTEAPEEEAEEPAEEPAPEVTEEVTEAPEEEAEEEPVAPEVPDGSLMIAKGTSKTITRKPEPVADLNAVDVGETDTEERVAVVTVYEDEDVTNGKYVITYDPDLLALKSLETAAQFSSYTDDGEGTITFAFAQQEEALKAETDIVTLTFEVNSCAETSAEVATEERGEAVGLEESETISIEGVGHKWGKPEWSWEGSDEEGWTAKALFTCEIDPEHTDELDAEVSYEVTFEPTLEKEGEGTWTATVTKDGVTYTDRKTVVLPKLEAYKIILKNYNEELIETSLVANKQYEPDTVVTFTVSADLACVVALENADGSFTRLECTTTDAGEHEFTVTITDADLKLHVTFKGDAKLDGKVNGMDMTWVKQVVLGNKTIEGFAVLAGDVNVDTKVNGMDMTLIQKIVLNADNTQW